VAGIEFEERVHCP
jgi:hypothetical protein